MPIPTLANVATIGLGFSVGALLAPHGTKVTGNLHAGEGMLALRTGEHRFLHRRMRINTKGLVQAQVLFLLRGLAFGHFLDHGVGVCEGLLGGSRWSGQVLWVAGGQQADQGGFGKFFTNGPEAKGIAPRGVDVRSWGNVRHLGGIYSTCHQRHQRCF